MLAKNKAFSRSSQCSVKGNRGSNDKSLGSLHLHMDHRLFQSRDSSVGIALGYELDDRCSRVGFPTGLGNFSLHHRVQNGSGAPLASYGRVPRAISLGVKRPGREADYSPLSSAEVKE
jgi:hypothetical protein